MRQPLQLRELTAEEQQILHTLVRSRTAPYRLVERAKIIEQASCGQSIPQIAESMQLNEKTIRKWFKRFAEQGLAGLEDAPAVEPPHAIPLRTRQLSLRWRRPRPASSISPSIAGASNVCKSI